MMPISESARADLYTGLSEVLGPDRAETLMAQLPRFDPAEVATQSDVAVLRSDTAVLRSDVAVLRSEVNDIRAELHDGLGAVNQRLDRLFLTLLVGSFGIVATMLGVIVTVAG
jgi:hypothetical protein